MNKENISTHISFAHFRRRILIGVLVLIFAPTVITAQVMVSATGKPSSLVICGADGMFSLQVANTTGSTMTGATLLVSLPTGARYTPGSVVGATELNISNLSQPVFSLPDILNNSAHTVTYNAGLFCGYANTQNFNYTVTYNSSNYTGFDTPLQNYYYPEPVITSIVPAAAVIPVNTTVLRNITIQQQGINSTLDTLYILDEHTSDIQVLSTTIGVLHPYVGPGPLRVDTIILTGSDFPGANGLFDAGETVVIGETVKLVGCTNGQSTLKAAWGCNGQICNFYASFPSVSPAAGTTSIGMAFTNNNVGWGFIDNRGWVEFTVTNNGTGAGTAFDLSILSGFSSGGSTYYPNSNWLNKIDSFSVAGHALKASYNYAAGALNGQYAYYTKLQYTTDPDGAGTGLEDSDGDGFFDDLPVGKSITIKAHTYYDWAAALTSIPVKNTCGAGWTNSAWQAFRYGYNYKNQCSIPFGVNWLPNGNLLMLQTYDTRTVQHTIPSDFYNLVPVWMEHLVNTSTSVGADGCPNDSVFYKLILPPGVTIAAGTATFKGVSMGPPDIHGDTVFYYLSRSKILTGGLFRVPLMLDCTLPHSTTGFVHAELKFWCDKISYKDRYFTYWCSNSPVFALQCPNPSCTDPSISYFKIKRTTLGWTNNLLTAKVSPATPGLRLDNAMARDSICIVAAGKINGPVDSLYFKLSHTSLGGGWGNQLFFNYLADTLFFFDNETSTWHTCSGLNPQITNGATSSLVTWFGNLTNPGNCLSGYSFTAGDSIRYVIYGSVKNLAQTNWITVPTFRGSFYWTDTKVSKSCNDIGTIFNVLGSKYNFSVSTFYQQIVLQGCTSFLYEGLIYTSMESCGGDIAFPNEIRPYNVLDTLIFTLPEGFVYQAGSAKHSYNQDNTSAYLTEVIPDPLITVGPTGTKLTFIRTPLWNYSDYYDCSSDLDRIIFYAVPSCKATGDYTYSMDARGRYQFYADKQGIRGTSTSTKSISYTAPLVNLTPLIITAEGLTDTVLWTVRLCNLRSFSADNNWLALESTSGGIQVTEISDITNFPVIVPVAISSYGPGKTWAQLGSYTSNACHIYRVRAVYNSCSYDSLKVRSGYSCSGYPMTPELGYPPSGFLCTENNAYLYLDPKEISLNLSILSPVNPVELCDTLVYESEVTNSQLSTARNLKLTVALPPGSAILGGQSGFKFPYTTGGWKTLGDPVNLPAGSNKWVYDISSDPNGVPVLKGVDSIPKNGYRLRFRLLTDCDYISGTSLKITASATNSCSDVKTRTSYTEPLLITGLPTNVNLYVISTSTSDAFFTCSANSDVRVKIINLGPNNISNIEKLGITIDDAYDYVNASLVNIHNGPSGVASNTITGGDRYIRFSIQPNLTVNDSIVFSFELHDIDPGTLTCDTLPMETTTLLVGKVYCSLTPGDSCVIQSITASVISQRPVIKDHVGFTPVYSASSIPNGTIGEIITVHYKVKNTGIDPLNSAVLKVVFVHDGNNNGVADDVGADSLFSQNVSVAGLAPGDSVSVVATFPAPAGKVCQLLAGLRLNDNVCSCSDEALPIPVIHLDNAGPDVTACVQVTTAIGTPGITGYTYIWIPSSYLNSNTISDPQFTYPGFVAQPDTLIYQLVTTRPGNCQSRDTVRIIVLPVSTANAGPDTTVCSGSSVRLANSSALNYLSVHWLTAGNGTFDNSSTLHPIYSPGPADLANGFVNLSLIASGSCAPDTDIVRVNYSPVATANAGRDTLICEQFSYSISTATASNNSSVAWSTTGNGTFSSTSTLSTVYTPGAGDIVAGFVNLVLTANGNPPCGPVSDTMKLLFKPPPSLITSPLSQSICSGDSLIVLLMANQPGSTFSWTAALGSGSVTGFSNGSGNSIRQKLMNPGIVDGTVIYSITPANAGCIGTATPYTATVKPLPSVTNNPLSETICSGMNTNIVLSSLPAGSTYSWTITGASPSVTGFGPGSGPVISQVLFNGGVTSGTVTYHITPVNSGCTGPASDFIVTVLPGAAAYAGKDTLICNQFTYSTGNATAANFTSVAWSTTGNGSFTNPNVLNTVYTPGPNDILAGFVRLILTAAGNPPCGTVTDTMKLSFKPPPTLTTSPLSQSICSGDSLIVLLTANQPGTTFSWTAVLGSGTVTGFANGAGSSIRQKLTNAGVVNGTVIYTITPANTGCIGVATPYTATVKPLPSVTNNPLSKSICNGTPTNIALTSSIAGTTFSWTITAASPSVTGYGAGSGPVINQVLFNSAFTNGSVTYHITPVCNGCTGQAKDYTVMVYPVPDVYFNPAAQTICSETSCNISLLSHVAGTTYTWTASGSSFNISGYSNGSGNTIAQLLNNSANYPGTATYQVSPTANGCPGTSASVIVTVNPLPPVLFTACNDIVTTSNAKLFRLKGGTPLGGTYSGAGVAAGFFNPALAGVGNHSISYSVTNQYLCSDQALLSFTVQSPPAFACDNPFTDIRDGKSYPTVHIGSQCWMAANLDHGNVIASSAMQRDNCAWEKYCYGDNPMNCVSNGGLYQWDELMQFEETEGTQGFCPPAWHVPTENDWNILFSVYINNGFAGFPLLYSGYSGFNALLSGARHINSGWNFQGFATFFWSSTPHGPYKAWAHGMNDIDPSVSYYPSSRANAFSVRCVKD
ncbi:MAG: hypothetical protein NTU98_11210 [Bacteroidetes bacterium]|nr:hypothetical protein [Bacteroidota bacterium]